MISSNIRSTGTAALLALLAVVGLGAVAATGSADTNWGVAAEGEVAVQAPVPPAPPQIHPRDSDWG
ncbi:hypothetical protein OG730_42220 (plasmid) [Streptomyces sp. NBC_01298]|uniref:hypothetical protein n=1 Tax=Streptomyces sp. NBC_01298 TaxID=2903817 RepID=UPI002E0EFDBA|nr:hypothetical protein OG730_42220 [Streptomyces sp. NBC_01298]